VCREGNGSAGGSLAGGGANAINDERSGWLNILWRRGSVLISLGDSSFPWPE